MNEIQLNEIINRAKNFIGQEIPVDEINSQQTLTVNYKFVKIGRPTGIGESDGSKTFTINATLESPTGYKIDKPLKEVVRYFESKKG